MNEAMGALLTTVGGRFIRNEGGLDLLKLLEEVLAMSRSKKMSN